MFPGALFQIDLKTRRYLLVNTVFNASDRLTTAAHYFAHH